MLGTLHGTLSGVAKILVRRLLAHYYTSFTFFAECSQRTCYTMWWLIQGGYWGAMEPYIYIYRIHGKDHGV